MSIFWHPSHPLHFTTWNRNTEVPQLGFFSPLTSGGADVTGCPQGTSRIWWLAWWIIKVTKIVLFFCNQERSTSLDWKQRPQALRSYESSHGLLRNQTSRQNFTREGVTSCLDFSRVVVLLCKVDIIYTLGIPMTLSPQVFSADKMLHREHSLKSTLSVPLFLLVCLMTLYKGYGTFSIAKCL